MTTSTHTRERETSRRRRKNDNEINDKKISNFNPYRGNGTVRNVVSIFITLYEWRVSTLRINAADSFINLEKILAWLCVGFFCVNMDNAPKLVKKSMRTISYFFHRSCNGWRCTASALIFLKIELVFNENPCWNFFKKNINNNNNDNMNMYTKKAHCNMELRCESKRYFVIWADPHATHATNPIPLLLTTEMHIKTYGKKNK